MIKMYSNIICDIFILILGNYKYFRFRFVTKTFDAVPNTYLFKTILFVWLILGLEVKL